MDANAAASVSAATPGPAVLQEPAVAMSPTATPATEAAAATMAVTVTATAVDNKILPLQGPEPVSVDMTGRVPAKRKTAKADAVMSATDATKTAQGVSKYIALEQGHSNNLVCDIGQTVYTEKATARGGNLTPIAADMSDNVTCYHIFPIARTTDAARGRGIPKEPFDTLLDKYRACWTLAGIKASGHLHLSPNFTLVGGDKRDQGTRMNVSAAIEANPQIMATFQRLYPGEPTNPASLVVVRYKVSLADVPPELAFAHGDDRLEQDLASHGFYFYDQDGTQDNAGTINKRELERHLVAKHGFHEQRVGSTCLPYIVDNDRHVGINCLTVIFAFRDDDDDDEGALYEVRHKWYNKWDNQMVDVKAPTAGNHIAHIFDPHGEHMKTVLGHADARARGLTRSESTILCRDGRRLSRALFLKIHAYARRLVQRQIYDVPFAAHWEAMTQNLTSSLMIYHPAERLVHIAFFVNLTTRLVTGMEFHLPKGAVEERDIDKALAWYRSKFSFMALPLHQITVQHGDGDMPSAYSLGLETFVKANGPTILTLSKKPFALPSEASGLRVKDVTPEQLARLMEARGFPATGFVSPGVHAGGKQVKYTDPAPFPARRVATPAGKAISTMSLAQRDAWLRTQRLKAEATLQQEVLRDQVAADQERARRCQAEIIELEEHRRAKTAYQDAVRAKFASAATPLWRRFDREGPFQVRASAVHVYPATNAATKETYDNIIIYDEEVQAAFYCPSGALKAYIKDECLPLVEVFRAADHPAHSYHYELRPGNVFLAFRVTGKTRTQSNNATVEIADVGSRLSGCAAYAPAEHALVRAQKELKAIQAELPVTSDVLSEASARPDKVKLKDCDRVKELPPNTTFTVVALSRARFHNKDRFLLRLHGLQRLVVSNDKFDTLHAQFPNVTRRPFKMRTVALQYDPRQKAQDMAIELIIA
jgi:hypothetical protein